MMKGVSEWLNDLLKVTQKVRSRAQWLYLSPLPHCPLEVRFLTLAPTGGLEGSGKQLCLRLYRQVEASRMIHIYTHVHIAGSPSLTRT